MSVSLNPSSSLGFHRPLTQLAKRALTITNNNAQPIAFKVKTTAPKLYCVRPNSGRVEPGQSVEVSVMLQAMKEDPPPNAKCKDKFLIQSTLITPEKETMALQDIWSVPEGSDESSKVHQQKLRVMYLPPEGQPLPEEPELQVVPPAETPRPPANGIHHPTSSAESQQNGIHVDEEPTQQAVKPEPQRSLTPHNEYTVASEPLDHEEPTRDVPIQQLPSDLHLSGITPAVSAFEGPPDSIIESRLPAPEPEQTPLPIPPVASRLPSAQPLAPVQLQEEDIATHPLFQELVSQYNAAIEELDLLRKDRVRSSYKGPSDTGSIASDTDVQDGVYQQDGVPLQIVVIIALAVFITTYLFL